MNGITVGNHYLVDAQVPEDLLRDNEEAMVIVLRAAEPVPNERDAVLGKPKRTHPVSPVAGRRRGR